MQQVKLPETITGSIYSSKGLNYLHNCFNIDGTVVPRLSLHRLAKLTTTNVNGMRAEALVSGGGKMYAIFADAVYNATDLTDDEAFNTSLGAIEYPVTSWAASNNKIVVIAQGFGYIINTATNGVALITDGDFPECKSVVYADGRFLYLAADGESIFYSDVNDPSSVNALSFFDAETRPDLNREIAVIGNDIYIFGDESIERMVATGDSAAPYRRVTNSLIAVGYVGGLIRLSDRIAFIGRRVGGAVSAYELIGGQARVISNQSVNELLNVNNSIAVRGLSFSMYGRDIYTFTFIDGNSYADVSFDNPSGLNDAIAQTSAKAQADIGGEKFTLYCMMGGEQPQWGFLSSLRDNATNLRQEDWGIADIGTDIPDFDRLFTPRASLYFNGKWNFLIGHALSTAQGADLSLTELDDNFGIYTIADSRYSKGNLNVDFGESEMPITKGIKMGYETAPNVAYSLPQVEVVYNKQGYNRMSTEANPTGGDSNDVVNLRVSATGVGWGYVDATYVNGKGWSDEISRPIGDKGDQHKLVFTKSGGLVQTNGYTGVIIESQAEVPFVIEGIYV